MFSTISQVTMEPSWRATDTGRTYSFFVTTKETDKLGFSVACAEARTSGLPNARVFTPHMVEWASIFHPAFFAAMSRHEQQTNASSLRRLTLKVPTSQELNVATTTYWLQSTLFLAGVTLSAAIIQGRFSTGTIASKLDRLWQAGAIAEEADIPELTPLHLKDTVIRLAREIARPESLLLPLKHCFAEAIAALAVLVPVKAEEMTESHLSPDLSDRFGFRHDLAAAIGSRLRCMIVYGSSVTSNVFADYDIILVTEERDDALCKLRSLMPTYRGFELNLSVFEPEEFWNYQVLSGDNLSHHGICIKGETIVPRKTEADLLARNFSFGFIRLRQIIGMCALPSAAETESTHDDKRSLHEYFAKIPMNVARGILGAKSISVTKEELLSWSVEALGYSPAPTFPTGHVPFAMSAAAWATHHTMIHFNSRYCVCDYPG